MSDVIEVFLNNAQKKKFEKGDNFQLSATQLQSDDGEHHVEIEMQPKHKKELLRNVSKNKGYRFSAEKVVGGSILGDIARGLGKKFVKKGANKLLDTIGNRTKHRGITDGIKNHAVDPLVNFGVDRISGGKMAKGSPEMAEKMARLRGMKKSGSTAVKHSHSSNIEGNGIIDDIRNTLFKISGGSMRIGSPEMNKLEMEIKNEHESINGSGIFDDIRNGWNRTFNKKLGRKIKKTLTSPTAKKVYKGLTAGGLAIGSRLTGLPLGLARGAINNQIDGASIKKKDNLMVEGGTLVRGVPQVQVRSGAGFTGKSGTRYGGSFKAESRGGSMYTA
jgi:hypothetical protein